jgi:hypothetical protein
MACLWGAIFGWNVVRIIYNDHADLKSQRDSANREYRSPEFSGEISGIFSARHQMDGRTISVILISAIITNPHGPPSGIMNWKMGIKNPTSGITWGNTLPLSTKDQRGPVGHGIPGITFPNNKYLVDETLEPIAAGASVVGWFWSTFTQNQIDEAYKSHHYLILQFRDAVSGTEHTMEKQFPEPGFHWEGVAQ